MDLLMKEPTVPMETTLAKLTNICCTFCFFPFFVKFTNFLYDIRYLF